MQRCRGFSSFRFGIQCKLAVMKAKKILSLYLLLCLPFSGFAQLSASSITALNTAEDSLKVYANKMIFDREASLRFTADSIFIRNFVKALKTPYSFDYPFDSLQTVSRIYSPDSTFRIITWQFMRDETYFRQRGAIQVKTPDGSLKLFPLIDMSDFTDNPTDSVRTNFNWIGAIYYNIILKTFNGRKYYTLFGYDDNDFRSTRKWLEVLTFAPDGKPAFGGRYFVYPDDGIKAPQPAFRFLLEYKKDAAARISYDRDLDLIIFDHLVSESKEPSKRYTLVPDGDQEGFRWKDGQWVYVEKVFKTKLQDGQFPVEMPIKDDAGKTNEAKLMEQSQKNMKKELDQKKAEAEKKKQDQKKKDDKSRVPAKPGSSEKSPEEY